MNYLKLSLLISLGLNAYFLVEVMQQRPIQNKDQVKLTSSAIEKRKNISYQEKIEKNKAEIKSEFLETEPRGATPRGDESMLSPKDFPTEAEMQQAFEEKNEAAKDFLSSRLNFTREEVDDYFKILQSMNKELDEFYRNIYETQGSRNFVFTTEFEIEAANIKKRYLDEMQDLLGKEGYEEYKIFRNEFNKKVMEDGTTFHYFEL